jgi:hypothetical protein
MYYRPAVFCLYLRPFCIYFTLSILKFFPRLSSFLLFLPPLPPFYPALVKMFPQNNNISWCFLRQCQHLICSRCFCTLEELKTFLLQVPGPLQTLKDDSWSLRSVDSLCRKLDFMYNFFSISFSELFSVLLLFQRDHLWMVKNAAVPIAGDPRHSHWSYQ